MGCGASKDANVNNLATENSNCLLKTTGEDISVETSRIINDKSMEAITEFEQKNEVNSVSGTLEEIMPEEDINKPVLNKADKSTSMNNSHCTSPASKASKIQPNINATPTSQKKLLKEGYVQEKNLETINKERVVECINTTTSSLSLSVEESLSIKPLENHANKIITINCSDILQKTTNQNSNIILTNETILLAHFSPFKKDLKTTSQWPDKSTPRADDSLLSSQTEATQESITQHNLDTININRTCELLNMEEEGENEEVADQDDLMEKQSMSSVPMEDENEESIQIDEVESSDGEKTDEMEEKLKSPTVVDADEAGEEVNSKLNEKSVNGNDIVIPSATAAAANDDNVTEEANENKIEQDNFIEYNEEIHQFDVTVNTENAETGK